LLLVLVAFMAVAEVVTRLMQPQAVIQHLELLLRSVVATAELLHASQVMVVPAAVAVTTGLIKESLSELQVKETPVVDRINLDTELAVAVAVQVAWEPMRLRNILEAPEVLEFRQRSRGLLCRTAAVAAAG
jgi:hypothetical protein